MQMQQPLMLDFVFAGQVREIVVVGEVLVEFEKLRSGVDDLIRVDAGHRAADDVASVVAACATRRHTDRGEFTENAGEILDAQPVILDGLAGGDVAEPVAEAVGDALQEAGADGGELAAGDLRAHHEEARFLRLLPIDAIPFHAVEVAGVDGLEAGLRIAINVVDDVEPVLLQLGALLWCERDEALLDGGKIRRDIGHRIGKKVAANLWG